MNITDLPAGTPSLYPRFAVMQRELVLAGGYIQSHNAADFSAWLQSAVFVVLGDTGGVVVKVGDSVGVTDPFGAKATGVAAVAGGVASVTLPSGSALLANGGQIDIQSSDGSTSVAGSADITDTLVRATLPATTAPVSSGGSVTVGDAEPNTVSGSAVVASGKVSQITLPGTYCLVWDSRTFTTVDGGTVTAAVKNGVPTLTYTAKAS